MSHRVHVAVLKAEYIDAILQRRKTVESRLSRTRRAPLHAVGIGDLVYFKQAGGGYRAAARVRRVEFFEDLSPRDVCTLQRRLNNRVLASPSYWQQKHDARYATLMWLADVRETHTGPTINRLFGRAWVSVNDVPETSCLSVRTSPRSSQTALRPPAVRTPSPRLRR